MSGAPRSTRKKQTAAEIDEENKAAAEHALLACITVHEGSYEVVVHIIEALEGRRGNE